MNYVDESLIGGEVVVYRGHTTWWSAFWPIFWGIFLGIFTGIGFLIMLPAIIRVMTTEIAITNKRVIMKTGLVQRDTAELNISRVESLNIHQSVTGRILRFGNIRVQGAGLNLIIPGIADASAFRRKFFSIQDTHYNNHPGVFDINQRMV